MRKEAFLAISLWVWSVESGRSLTICYRAVTVLCHVCAVNPGRGNIGINPQVSTLTWLVSGEGSFDVELDFQRGGAFKETINVPKPAPASL
jgi:hypothetical protein|eukprot:COSAG06_NODE_1376_length_9648_cov_67.818096_5_plen_91_part_00